jgi:hypothetical protein
VEVKLGLGQTTDERGDFGHIHSVKAAKTVDLVNKNEGL